jgi:hypothetical protein
MRRKRTSREERIALRERKEALKEKSGRCCKELSKVRNTLKTSKKKIKKEE